MLDIAVLMRENHIWVSVFVSWGLEIVDLKVFAFLGFVNTEVEITLSGNLGISVLLKSVLFLLRELVLKSHLGNFVLNQGCNL